MAGSDREQDETSVPASSQATLIPSTQADRGSSITSHLRTPAGTAVEYINPVVNSETQTTSSELSFVDALEKERGVLDDDYKNFEEDVKTRDTTENDLDELIWSDLQAEYEKDVAALALEEADLMKKFDARFKQFMLWMEVSDQREGERAKKRLKTQAALVQASEEELHQQEMHYSKVMEAFSGAMSLLQHQTNPS